MKQFRNILKGNVELISLCDTQLHTVYLNQGLYKRTRQDGEMHKVRLGTFYKKWGLVPCLSISMCTRYITTQLTTTSSDNKNLFTTSVQANTFTYLLCKMCVTKYTKLLVAIQFKIKRFTKLHKITAQNQEQKMFSNFFYNPALFIVYLSTCVLTMKIHSSLHNL